jgi:Fe2+ or Zn2+ uptake regulation protein
MTKGPDSEELKLLQDPRLLYNIIQEIKKEGIVGEEDAIICIIIKMMIRLVNNAKASSSNLIVSDSSGSGKDAIVKTIGNTIIANDKYFHRTDLSDKVLDYWMPSKEGWNGCVLSIEDPREEFLQSQSLKVFSSGGTHVTKVVEHKAIDTKIMGKPVIIITSLKATITDEGMRRWDSLQLDTSAKLTQLVTRNVLLKRAGKIPYNPNMQLRIALQQHMKSYNVFVPCAECLDKVLNDNLAMRTQVNKFIDFISASAVLHQYQREKDEHGNLIANFDDFELGYFVFMRLNSAIAMPLNKAEKELIKIILDAGEPIPVRNIISKMKGHGKKWFYDNLESFKEKGLIREMTKIDVEANKEITFYYAPRELKLENDLSHEAMISVVSGCFDEKTTNRTTKNQEKNEAGKVVVSVVSEICTRLDFDRNTMGLPSLFSYIPNNRNNQNNNNSGQKENGCSRKTEQPENNPEQPDSSEQQKLKEEYENSVKQSKVKQ